MSEKAANEQSKTLRDLQKLRRAVAQDHLKNKQKNPRNVWLPGVVVQNLCTVMYFFVVFFLYQLIIMILIILYNISTVVKAKLPQFINL